MTDPKAPVVAVVIGRNEGARLQRCIESVANAATRVVYVDSGSTDASIANAEAAGAETVALDPVLPFTAARARNAGAESLALHSTPEFVQFIDGDCELQPGWLAEAVSFLEAHPDVAIVCGRRRERFPEASIYNRLCDREWNKPPGLLKACGGDSLVRYAAFSQAGGFNPSLIAGEEPELCVRLRALGWKIWGLDAEMTLHDAAITRFSQWWKRMRRGGYAAAEGMALHGAPPERHGVQTVTRAVAWGFVLPAISILLTLAFGPLGLLPLLAYPAQIVRLWVREGGNRGAWESAIFTTLGKFAELGGVIDYWVRRAASRPAKLIEYKGR